MKIVKNDIEKLINDGYILKNKHPEYDIYILNYSATAQYEKVWNKYTIACRGLVVDNEYNIIARPFHKFFNYEEHNSPSLPDLPTDTNFEVYTKMDGSLGILFWYDNKWHLATRGSFTSDQAIRGMEIIKAKSNYDMIHFHLDTDYTYLGEIIYPQNRIVVDYGDTEDFVLLGAVNNKNGFEIPYDELFKVGFNVVDRHDGIKDFKKLQDLNIYNEEGFVIKYQNQFRVKVKFEEYCRLHKVLTNVSNKTIWEYLMNDLPFDEILDKTPDEFYDWVKKVKNKLNGQYNLIHRKSLIEYARIYYILDKTEKKEFALEAKKYKNSGILFSMYNNRPYSNTIWKLIKPKYTKPFFNEE